MCGCSGCSCCKNYIHLKSDSPVLTEDKLLSQVVCVFCWIPLSSSKNSSITVPPLVGNCGHMFHLKCLEFEEQKIHDFPIRCPECGQIIKETKILQFLNDKDREACNCHTNNKASNTEDGFSTPAVRQELRQWK